MLDIHLRAFVRRELRSRWIAVCPKIDVVTQGTTAEDAKAQLTEAVQAWFEDCLERGTLDQSMRECGFRISSHEEAKTHPERVLVSRNAEPDVLGDLFSVNVTIPAYQAAAIMASA